MARRFAPSTCRVGPPFRGGAGVSGFRTPMSDFRTLPTDRSVCLLFGHQCPISGHTYRSVGSVRFSDTMSTGHNQWTKQEGRRMTRGSPSSAPYHPEVTAGHISTGNAHHHHSLYPSLVTY